MAEAIKSALLVDYDSLRRSLADAGGQVEAHLADRAAAWVSAIESGRLIGPQGTHRRVLLRRCYAGPSVLGKVRDALAAAGFDVVDCGVHDSGSRSSADLCMAIDAIDALGQPNGAEEFILLTAAAELTPLLARLKASKRLTAIYVDAATAQRDKALADAFLDDADFADFLASDEVPVGEDMRAAAAADRAEIEAFARKIHAATNIPLFSPKTFAELFKHLTDEIRENSYHFQTTAKNVADRMTATGRNVTRRQVVFIVKGLALKGHVFSTTDSPDGLAEVFREQARYLITNAGMNLDPRQEQLLSAWFVSRPPPQPQKARTQAGNGAAAPKSAPPETTRQPDKPSAPARPSEPTKAAPVAKPAPATVKPVELPKSAAKPATPMKPAPSPAAREEAKAVIAARIAASAKLKPGAKPGTAGKSAPKPAQPQKRASDRASDALESSILAAIAEAVDVLVEDGNDDESPSREPPARRRPNNAAKPAQPPPAEEPGDDEPGGEESGDIGDQIQRIIASYNRNRSDE
jgi:hypothetical protein